ncbi:hypothetical protein SAMN05421678_103167 [Actinopolymorpha cephalotaxi]|uniref:Lipoprotein n=1 Tax=Actinopolymorpha cephalotaxi TaxID=504797 RepID=A0A1I2N246_9ACTN|nr:hypothetical protein [Actinopolymorpha cephalotaxi]NYH85728.1 hypothetical protein [Actinopolymorpha cephalotaxi]SFF97713.1 hypothetical protein SAMN05421678_103167 [Actinopolymorpha cephalotaxi]
MRWLAVSWVASLAVLLAGCTVPVNGLTGISVDQQGHLIVVLAWCGRTAPDGAVIFHDVGSDESGQSVGDADYDAPKLSGGLASFRVDAPGDGWKLDGKPPRFREKITYSAFGGTNDNSWSTGNVDFQLATTRLIQPGHVLLQEDNGHDIQVTRRVFYRMAHDPNEVECG